MDSAEPGRRASDSEYKSSNTGQGMAIDPVCNMEVDQSDTKFHSQYESRNFYFCSEECKDTFDNKPQQFAPNAG
jgi:P-type Cu+ transporter